MQKHTKKTVHCLLLPCFHMCYFSPLFFVCTFPLAPYYFPKGSGEFVTFVRQKGYEVYEVSHNVRQKGEDNQLSNPLSSNLYCWCCCCLNYLLLTYLSFDKHNREKTVLIDERTRVWRIFGYLNIFEYFPIQIFVHIIFVSFLLYEYIRMFVRIVFFYANIFGYSFV